MTRDMHSNISVIHAIPPVAIGTTGIAGGQLSDIIDRRGYNSAEFSIAYGLKGATGDSTVAIMYEAAATGDTFTSVADADLLGTEVLAGISAAPHVSGTTQNVGKRLGYKGNKRYLRLRLYGIGHATGLVAANAILGHPAHAPVA